MFFVDVALFVSIYKLQGEQKDINPEDVKISDHCHACCEEQQII